MEPSSDKGQEKKKVYEVNTFTVPFPSGEYQQKISLITNPPRKPSKEQIVNQAFKFHLEGKILEAMKYYQSFINQGFSDHRVFSNYGVLLKNLGRLEDAELSLRKAIDINPDFAEAYSNLGNLLRDRGNLEEAELSIRKAIDINPSYANAYSNLSAILNDLGKSKEAELSLRKAIELNPNFAEAYSNLGTILKDLDNLQEAELSYLKAIKLDPDFSNAYFNLFRHYEQINNLKKLEESLNEFNNIKSIENEILLFRARLSFRNKKNQTARKLINSISPKWIEKSHHIQKTIFWSYKAFIEDKVGNYDIAYSCFEKSQNKSEYSRFCKDTYLNFIGSYKNSIINKNSFHNKVNTEVKDSNLAFLIGFPRSGTTLLDTILRSHRDIEIIEEEPLIPNIDKLVKEKFNTRIEDLYSLSVNKIMILRKKYFELLKKYINEETSIIIDKMPLHTVSLPLINLLFPNAKIIFTHRHPYDTVLSCFQQSFKPNKAMANLVSLKSSSIMYDQVMDAWDIYKNNLPLNFITSKYEHLIEDFDNHSLRILEFLGVGWDENIKNYRQTALNRSKINTPSSSQVVQPLYKSSIEKWKNYEKYFNDCHQYLGKWVSYFNY